MTQTNKLEWWIILKISLRAKAAVPKILVKRKHCLHSLYFPLNTLMLTEARREFSDLHSNFRLCVLCYKPVVFSPRSLQSSTRVVTRFEENNVIDGVSSSFFRFLFQTIQANSKQRGGLEACRRWCFSFTVTAGE